MSSIRPQEEIQALEVGMDVRGLDKSQGPTWLHNIFWRNGRYEVRQGFGTLAQFGTTLTGGRDTALGYEKSYGYTELLGTYLHTTDFDHRQILSLHKMFAYSGDSQENQNGVWKAGSRAGYLNLLALNVYDVTTDRRVEFILHQGTQEITARVQGDVQPHYQQMFYRSTPKWVSGSTTVSAASFTVIRGQVYIGIPGLGVWQYRPVDPSLAPGRFLHVGSDYDVDNYGARSLGESSALQRVIPSPGEFVADGRVYRTPDEIIPPTAIANYLNRLVIASDQTLYFSDADQPGHYIADNVSVIPTEQPITAMIEIKGVLLVFTAQETWLYQPNADDTLVSGGRIYSLSKQIGCLSQRHITSGDTAAYWMDARGVYTSAGGADITRISDNIDPWFSQPEQMKNPMTSYQVASGVTDLSDDQPPARVDWQAQLKPEYGNVVWDQQNRRLFCTGHTYTLMYQQDSGWTTWAYETSATVVNNVPKVGLQRNITNPMLAVKGTDVYLMGDFDETTYTDRTLPPDEPNTVIDKSFYILQLGRGGALDRSSAGQEDQRSPVGSWQKNDDFTGLATFYVGKPVKLPSGFKTIYSTTTADTWLIPVYLSGDGTAMDQFRLHFRLTSHFVPLVTGAGVGEVDFIVPPERLSSSAGYTDAGMDAVHEVRSYTVAGALSDVGPEIRIAWKGSLAPNTWAHHPNMNLNSYATNPILYIPVQRKTGVWSSETALRIVDSVVITDAHDTSNTACSLWLWRDAPGCQPEQLLTDDKVAQPVDWAYKTRNLGNGSTQLKARGVFMKVQSYGYGTDKKVPGWIWGPLNTVTGSDYRDFAAQSIDYTNAQQGVHTIESIDSIRARLMPPLTTVIQNKVGNNVAKWGDSTDASKGNLLIDDAPVDTIATSEGVRGEQVSVMVLGCMNHPAETIKLQDVKIVVREVGGRRRMGR